MKERPRDDYRHPRPRGTALRRLSDPFFPDGLPSDPSGSRAGAGLPALPGPVGRGMGPRPSGGPPEPVVLLRALGRQWPLALSLGLAAAALTGYLALKCIPRPPFTAVATLEVKTQKPILLSDASQEKIEFRAFQATQLALIHSRFILSKALASPGVAGLPTVRAQPSAVDWLEEALRAEFQPSSELMHVSLSGQRPEDLAAVVNAVAATYLAEVVTKDQADRALAAAKIKTLLDDANVKLNKQRAEHKRKAELVGSDDKQALAIKQSFALKELGEEQKELSQVHAELSRAQVELSVLAAKRREGRPDGLDASAVEEALALDPVVERYREQADAVLVKLQRASRLSRSQGDPSLRNLRTQYELAEKAVRNKIEKLRPKVEGQLREQGQGGDPSRYAELDTKVRTLAEYEKVLAASVSKLEIEAKAFNRQTLDLSGPRA